jgi:hypothetical protein
MKRILLLLFLAVTSLAAAQERRERPDSARAAQLRAEVERRFVERVTEELQLTDDQAGRLRAMQEKYGERRQPLRARQRALRQALQEQLRPGQAANGDSVSKLLDELRTGRAEMFAIEQAEEREISGFLTPVQQARFHMMRQRLVDRVRDIRRGGVDSPRQRRGRRGEPRQGSQPQD